MPHEVMLLSQKMPLALCGPWSHTQALDTCPIDVSWSDILRPPAVPGTELGRDRTDRV